MSATAAKNEVLEELKHQHLTKVIGRKPTAFDVDRWEDEASEMVTAIKTRAIPEGMEHGHAAVIVPVEEYRLMIDDEEYVYIPPTDPGAYPALEGDEEDHERRRLEAEHNAAVSDYYKYLGVQEHLRREFQNCVDEVWIEGLQNTRGGYGHVTARAFLDHLRTEVATLTTREEQTMKNNIKVAWNQALHIKKYFLQMEKARAQAERWGVNIDDADMVNEATLQMLDSGKFDHKFLRDWEQLAKHEKTWETLKDYFGKEYVSLVRYKASLKGNMGSINQMTEQTADDEAQDREVTQYLEDLRRDALVGNEQIQQMSEAFTGAATTMKEVMERLKASQAEVKKLTELVATLTKTNATLTETNKQLTANNKTLTETIKKGGGAAAPAENKGGGQWKSAAQRSNPEKEGCNICGIPHAKPFVKFCWELEVNASKRKPGWESTLK